MRKLLPCAPACVHWECQRQGGRPLGDRLPMTSLAMVMPYSAGLYNVLDCVD